MLRIRTSPWRLTQRITRAQSRGVHRVAEARVQEAKILTTRTDHKSKYDPKQEEFWEMVKLPGDDDNSHVYRGKGIEALHAEENPCKHGSRNENRPRFTASRRLQRMQRPHDRMDHVGRVRLAETCESRDDSPSPNLGRVEQGEVIGADDMDPPFTGRSPQRKEREPLWTPAAVTQSYNEDKRGKL